MHICKSFKIYKKDFFQVNSGESFANDDDELGEDKDEEWEDVEEWDQDYPTMGRLVKG